jgi:hypothetical protein
MTTRAAKQRLDADASPSRDSRPAPVTSEIHAAVVEENARLTERLRVSEEAASASAAKTSSLTSQLVKTRRVLAETQELCGADEGMAALDALLETNDGKRLLAQKAAEAIGRGVREHVREMGWERSQPFPTIEAVEAYRDIDHLQAGRESPAWLFQVRVPSGSPSSPAFTLPIKRNRWPAGCSLSRPHLSRHHVQTFLDELFVTTAPSSASTVGAESEHREARSARLKATMTDATYASASAHYSSIFATLEALYVKCKTNSREVVDVVSGRSPGGPSYTKLQDMCEAWVDTWESEFKLDADTMLLLLMDNVGRYKTGTGRIGDAGTLKAAVVTNAAAAIFRDCENLQRTAALSPANWEKQWRDTPATIFDLETEPREGEQRSEVEILKAQRNSHQLQCFASIDATKDPVTGAWSDPIVEEYPRVDLSELAAAQAAEVAAEERLQTRDGHSALLRDAKICPACETPWFKYKGKCGLCGEKLPGIDDFRAAAGGPAAAPTMTEFPTSGAPRQYEEPETRVESVDEFGHLRTRPRAGETDSPDASGSGRPQIQTLPFEPVNPAGVANITYMVNKLATIANLRGAAGVDGVVDEELIREWLIIIRDFGATENLDLQIPNILSLLGAGHEEMAYLRVVSKLVYILCGGDLMDILGFLTENAGLMLAAGKSTHKAGRCKLNPVEPVLEAPGFSASQFEPS